MPELPEVESVRKYLESSLEKSTLLRIDPLFPGVFTHASKMGIPDLPARYVGSSRRGKMLALLFQNDQTLLIHLRMTGRLYFPQPEDPLLSHTHVLFHLEDGRLLGYSDPRRFGRLIWHSGTPLESIPELAKLGEDALSISIEDFATRLKSHSRMIKPLLLDQTVVSGLGNIYVDESLFRAGIHPKQISSALSKPRLRLLWESMARVLDRAIQTGGSTIRDFVGSSGESGNYQKEHAVYGRGGRGCVKCGETLRRILVAQRGTTFCPNCQKIRYARKRAKTIRR